MEGEHGGGRVRKGEMGVGRRLRRIDRDHRQNKWGSDEKNMKEGKDTENCLGRGLVGNDRRGDILDWTAAITLQHNVQSRNGLAHQPTPTVATPPVPPSR